MRLLSAASDHRRHPLPNELSVVFEKGDLSRYRRMSGYQVRLTSCKRARDLSPRKTNAKGVRCDDRSRGTVFAIHLRAMYRAGYVVTISLRESMSYLVNVSLTALHGE